MNQTVSFAGKYLLPLIGIVFLLMPIASAQIPQQDNPVYTTPAPAEQPLGPPADAGLPPNVRVQEKAPPPGGTVSGRLETIEFTGNRFYRDPVIEGQLKPLTDLKGQPIDTQTLDSILTRINRQNPYRLKATVQPGSTPDAMNVHLDVYERQPWQISGTTDNQGRPRIGTQRGGVQLFNESLFGFGDRFLSQYIGASGTNFVQGNYDVPVNNSGGLLGAWAEFTHHEVELVPTEPDEIGEQYAYIVRFSQPFDTKRIWTGETSFTFRHINANNQNLDPRFLYTGLRFNRPDNKGSTLAYLQSYLGEQWFGGDSRFWRIRGQLNRLQKLKGRHEFLWRSAAQYSPDALPAVQMFQLAGEYQVRGYSEGLLYSDSGHFHSLEYHYPIPFLARISPWLDNRMLGIAFFDFAQGWLRSTRNQPVRETLVMSTGLGLRCRLTQYLQGFMDVAWGLGNHQNFNYQNLIGPNIPPSTRIHFGIRSDLLPRDFQIKMP